MDLRTPHHAVEQGGGDLGGGQRVDGAAGVLPYLALAGGALCVLLGYSISA